MLVWTLFLAAIGFALLVVALITGSVLWAWICIAVCVAGAFVLLTSVLWVRPAGAGDGERSATTTGPGGPVEQTQPSQAPDPVIARHPEGPNEITQELDPFPTYRSARHRK